MNKFISARAVLSHLLWPHTMRVYVVSCPAAPPTYGKVRLVTIEAFLGPSAPKWGWPIRVERNDVITLFDGGTMDSLWALTS